MVVARMDTVKSTVVGINFREGVQAIARKRRKMRNLSRDCTVSGDTYDRVSFQRCKNVQ